MEITLSVQELLICILIAAAIVLIIYLMTVLARLKPMIEKLNDVLDDAKSVLDDAKAVTVIASDKVEKFDEICGGVGDTVGTVVGIIRANRPVIKGAATLVSAATAVSGFRQKRKNKKNKKNQ